MSINRTSTLRQLRERLRHLRAEILRRFPEERSWMQKWLADAPHLSWVLGGPRCGTSAFKAALGQHARVLSLPGEHRCYFTLLERNYPDHGTPAEADDAAHLPLAEREELLEMILMSAFAGPVVAQPDEREIERYAFEWALRLPMQWPQLALDPKRIVAHVQRVLREFLNGGGTVPSDDFDITLMKALRTLDERIDPRMYDLPATQIERHFGHLPVSDTAPVPVIVEITPYVVLQPRRLKTPALEASTLLLKASSDPFRLRTMLALFAQWQVQILHLTRNPLASINGLLDGWEHRGFWQHDLSGSPGVPVARRHWKFDLVDDWESLSRADAVTLCAAQWRVPNQRILDAETAGLAREQFAFEDFLRGQESRVAMLERAFATMKLEVDAGARAAMSRPVAVNVTKTPMPARWKSRAQQLRPVLQDVRLCQTARRLGYDEEDHDAWV